jgi:diguanylate cyclase (GGDEF)-like protein
LNDDIPEQVKQVLAWHAVKSETGLSVIGTNDRFLFCNPTFISMFGLEDYSLIGRTHGEFMAWIFTHKIGSAGKRNATFKEWKAQVGDSPHRAHAYRSFETDEINGRWLLVAQQVYESGEIVSVCTDITATKEAELALHVAYAELERLAMTDELTGVPNRRYFLSQLKSERQRALRYTHHVTLAMLDLDHFKQVNDRYGHPAGDEVIKHFAAMLRSQMRCEDVVGRLGGEEFALLMPETTPSGAETVLERIRIELAQAQLDFIATGFGYTFSAGVAEISLTDPPTCDHWIREADQALYRAKMDGRNRTVLHQAE